MSYSVSLISYDGTSFMTKEKDEHSNHLVEVAAVAGGAAGVVL
jgi:hypothetical protein